MAGHVMNAGGGAWLLSESEREDGWSTDHAFLGREVARSTSETEESRGTIYGFLPATADDPYVAEDGKPAPLFNCLLYTSPSPRDGLLSRMPSSA